MPGVLFGYKGIILMLGVFLAYETRSVKLRRLIDSRFVGMSIYNIVVCLPDKVTAGVVHWSPHCLM